MITELLSAAGPASAQQVKDLEEHYKIRPLLNEQGDVFPKGK